MSLSKLAFEVVFMRSGIACVLLTAWILIGCGGGSGNSSNNPSTNPPAVNATNVTTSVDSSLQGTGALAVASSLSLVDKKPVGSPVLVQGGTVVYGLDAAGNVALAGNVVDAKVVFSATGTVLALGTTVLQGIAPATTLEQLQTRVKAADGYAALVVAVQSAMLAGKNPLEQISVQQGFDTVLASAARAAVQAQSAQPETAKALAVAPKHAPDSYEPAMLETATFKVSISNASSDEPTLASKVFLRNTLALNFSVALLNLTGAQVGAAALGGSGASLFSLSGALPVKVEKTLPGPFSVQLSVDDDKNKVEALNEVMSYVNPVNSECLNEMFYVAQDKVVEAGLTKAPLDEWTDFAIANAVWKIGTACALPGLEVATVKPLVAAYKLITKIVGYGKFVTDRKLVPDPIPDTGVCLTEDEYLMSCVSKITADAISPMMPGAVQPVNVLIFDEAGKKTSSPYGLKIEYSNPGLFELSSNMTTVNSNLNNVEGNGTFKITDPATDTTISGSVTVTNGKLEQAAYTVAPNGTVDVTLVDPASGIEVYRGASFDIYVADGSFGSFLPFNTTGLGALTFRASSITTPAPQPIRFNGARDSGSFISVESIDQFLTGSSVCTYNVIPCGSGYACNHWNWNFTWRAKISVGSSLYAQGVQDCGAWTSSGTEGSKICNRSSGQPEESTIAGGGEYSYYSGGEAPSVVNGSIVNSVSNYLVAAGRLALNCTYTP